MVRDGYNCCFSFWAIFCLEISSFYTILPKIIIIGYTVPETWRVMDVIVIFYFGLSFTPLTVRKIKISKKKMKKIPGDIIILHKYTKNHDHMLYCS